MNSQAESPTKLVYFTKSPNQSHIPNLFTRMPNDSCASNEATQTQPRGWLDGWVRGFEKNNETIPLVGCHPDCKGKKSKSNHAPEIRRGSSGVSWDGIRGQKAAPTSDGDDNRLETLVPASSPPAMARGVSRLLFDLFSELADCWAWMGAYVGRP